MSLVKYLNSLKYEHKNKKIAVKLLNLHQILGLFMKKTTFITVLVAIMMMAVTPAFAQDENGFQKFNVREDFSENGFQWFHDAELLAAGDKEKSNAMTIGWSKYFDYLGIQR